ncbi:hypothetical protein [Williamsia sterculiae]|uniref:hypothetical protein n=1 Tax=Williamsia sterculiae TaxID=1344003 RepID=UPI001F1DD6B6|nr:hypothetical protein [Williamsia sterculiae]
MRFPDEILLFGSPYLDGPRLQVPSGPARRRTSEGFTDYSILQEQDSFSIRESGQTRGSNFDDIVDASFGSFIFASKYFLFRQVAEITLTLVDPTAWNSLRKSIDAAGLAPGWTSRRASGTNGFPRTVYFKSSDPQEFYMTRTGDTRTSHTIVRSFRDINDMYSASFDVPSLGLSVPDTTT